ncbi:MAG TPA: glycosyltransferase [Pyrinomonadaceae bacterium]|nr:glycosyltransferase [Pyrinomonadaceae bacterium]
MSNVIQGLWIGAELSVMEQLSVASFLKNGHEYHLYVYDEVRNIPAGAVVKDGNAILPASMIFMYKEQKSYSGFSNFFRYKLLLERGGWWVDTDTVCVRPFDFAEEYVFSTEMFRGEEVVNSGVIKAPAGSEAMAYAWGYCEAQDVNELRWGQTGPRLTAETVAKFSLERYRQPHQAFCPVSFPEWETVLQPDAEWTFGETTRAVHLWNEMWRRGGRDKNARYDASCLYEQLKRRFLD